VSELTRLVLVCERWGGAAPWRPHVCEYNRAEQIIGNTGVKLDVKRSSPGRQASDVACWCCGWTNSQCKKGEAYSLVPRTNLRSLPSETGVKSIPNSQAIKRTMEGAPAVAPGAELAISSHSHKCIVGTSSAAADRASANFFQVFVRALCGRTITLDVQPTDTVAAIKANILRKDGAAAQPQDVRLAFAGKQLHDAGSLLDYGIGRDCTLQLSGRLLGGARLYHCTSQSNAESIKRSGFRCGSQGLAGGGIYFAESAQDAVRKARDQGCVLECEVNLGRVLDVGFSGDCTLTGSRLSSMGYDSVRIPRNGTEYCIYEPHRASVICEHRDHTTASVAPRWQLANAQLDAAQLQPEQVGGRPKMQPGGAATAPAPIQLSFNPFLQFR
jgi:hypothetical protein